jgi:hypothetical protein
MGLVEWLKVKALNSSPSTAKKKKVKRGSEISQSSVQKFSFLVFPFVLPNFQ